MPTPEEILKGIADTGDHQLQQEAKTTEAVKNLETPMEGILMKAAEIAKNTAPKDVQKVQILGPGFSIEEASVKMIKGDKGDQGEQGIQGPEGPKGADSTVPGPKGPKGDVGPAGQHGMSITGAKGDKGDPGKDGENGLKGDKGDPGKDGSPDTGLQIVKKIEFLPDGKRLDYEKLENLPDLAKIFRTLMPQIAPATTPVASKDYALSEMTDVSMQGILTGQLLQWDGHRFIPYTPATTTVTEVFGEAPTDSGNHTNFTLAHTPIAGSVRLYRGGSYQQSGAGNDYTITGGTITLSSSLVSGEILLADYNY